jgi:rubrerythrin
MSRSEIPSAAAIEAGLADMTLSEALAMARSFEETAGEFYRGLAERVSTEVRALALELAAEEDGHRRLLDELAADPQLAESLRSRIAVPSTTPTFESFVTLSGLGEMPSEDELLDYAQAREAIAREHYSYLAELAPPGPLGDLFAFLAVEEQKHRDWLDERWANLFSVL